jgi:hypothetical protein
MAELSAKSAASAVLIVARRGLLSDIPAHHDCRLFFARLSSLPLSTKLLERLSFWIR